MKKGGPPLAESLGLYVPTILLPKDGTDMTKWGTIACDQYTSDPAYWQRVEDFVGADPSAYKLILPEVFLETEKEEEVIANVKRTMQEYKEQQILVCFHTHIRLMWSDLTGCTATWVRSC